MRLTRLIGAALGTGFLFLALSSTASAYDGWRDRDRHSWRHGHGHWKHHHWKHDHWRDRRRTVVVRERPVIVERERPIFVQPQPMMMPMMPMMPYNQGPSGMNLNFNIPLN
ncbi:MAG TPA: hypothetical protein VEC60_10035 [Reyranella sp.]|nr:hypothetical protein [Reyranella sp.]